MTVHREPVRGIELAGVSSLFAETGQILSCCGKTLNPSSDRIDPDPAFGVKAQTCRTPHVLLLKCRKVVAETAGLCLSASPIAQMLSGGIKLLHAAQRCFGGVKIALAIAGQKRRASEECLGVWVATELAGLTAPNKNGPRREPTGR